MHPSEQPSAELANTPNTVAVAFRWAAVLGPLWMGILLIPWTALMVRGILAALVLAVGGLLWLVEGAIDPRDAEAAELRSAFAQNCAAMLCRHYGPSPEILGMLQSRPDDPHASRSLAALPRRESDSRSP
jgi:hypothetical protein